MTVTVSMPYYRNADWVETAVNSVLAQTHRDLVLVVVGDGENPPLSHIKDSRLVVYQLPENRGTYFAQQVVLQATPHAWYAPHAADDWSDPDHLESLLALGGTANVPKAVCIHMRDGSLLVQRLLWQVGVFDTERLRSIGGHNPSVRVEEDTLLMNILQTTGGISLSDKVTYHQVKRDGSLTTASGTGLGSRYRMSARKNRREVARMAHRLKVPERIRQYRESLVPVEVQAEVQEHAAKLAQLL